tara:strand:+ start:47 stop:385 length:339 start_codon:yes stop_codon:yes gene_type:complete
MNDINFIISKFLTPYCLKIIISSLLYNSKKNICVVIKKIKGLISNNIVGKFSNVKITGYKKLKFKSSKNFISSIIFKTNIRHKKTIDIVIKYLKYNFIRYNLYVFIILKVSI